MEGALVTPSSARATTGAVCVTRVPGTLVREYSNSEGFLLIATGLKQQQKWRVDDRFAGGEEASLT